MFSTPKALQLSVRGMWRIHSAWLPIVYKLQKYDNAWYFKAKKPLCTNTKIYSKSKQRFGVKKSLPLCVTTASKVSKEKHHSAQTIRDSDYNGVFICKGGIK